LLSSAPTNDVSDSDSESTSDTDTDDDDDDDDDDDLHNLIVHDIP
jgi:hypothetical protein